MDEEGNVVQHCTKETVEVAIHREISPRFSRLGSDPICNGLLFELLGHSTDTEAGAQLLEGTFAPPPGTNPATIIILNEITRIWRVMGEGKVNIIVTKEHCQRHYT